MKTYACFDKKGNCTSVLTGIDSLEGSILVPEGTSPNDVWLSPTGELVYREEITSSLPEELDVDQILELPPLADTKYYIGGQEIKDGKYKPDGVGYVTVQLKGRFKGTKEIKFLSYVEHRAKEYPSVEEQLDTIFHEGIDVWKAQIQQIKDKYPKPVNNVAVELPVKKEK